MALGFLLLPDARRHLVAYLCLFLAGAFVSLLAAQSLSGSGRGFLLLAGALFRATLLLRAPDLSEDVYRYLWDAAVAREGISPYRYAPDDPALAGVSSNLRVRLAHRDIQTVYPPAAQAVFRVFGGMGNLLVLKAFFAAADLAVVALLFSSGGEGAVFAAALYAFHPLAMTEIAGEGHLDSLGIALLLACLAYLRSGRRAAAGLALAASALTKYVSLGAAIPIFRRGRAACAASFVVLSVSLWLSASRGGSSPVGGLPQLATRWEFNSVLYPAAVELMDATRLPVKAKEALLDWKQKRHDPAWTLMVFPFLYSALFARALLAALLGAALLFIGWRVRDLETAVFASLAALLLFSPTLHPWYLLWVLPFACKRGEPAFLFLSFAAPVAYALLYPIPGVSAWLVLSLEYIPFAVLLAGSLGIVRLALRPLPEAA